MANQKSENGTGPRPTPQRINNAKIIKPTKNLGTGPQPKAKH